MNAHDADPLLPEPADLSAPGPVSEDAAEAKPKRKRAVRKPAEPSVAAGTDGDAVAALPQALAEPVVAPPLEALFPPLAPSAAAPAAEELAPLPATKPRRTRKAVETGPTQAPEAPEPAPVQVSTTNAAQTVAEAVARAVTESVAPGPAAQASAAAGRRGLRAEPPEGTEPAQAGAAVQGEAADHVDHADDTAAPGDDGQAADAAGTEGTNRPRKSRNRRRGRRGADRQGAGVEGVEGAGDADGAAELVPGQAPAEGDAGEAQAGGAVRAPRPARQLPPLPPPVDPGQLFAEVLSGAFDEEVETDEVEPLPVKRVLAAEPDAPKLHKVLAQAGVGSRRDMEQKIVEGRITVNGEPAHTGQRISFGDRIAIDGKPVRVRIAPPPARVIAYHKPVGEVVTHDDPQQRPTVFRRLPRLQQGKWQSVGRLDINTEGLLLFTNSGELANQLMHPRFGVEREYAVRSLGVLSSESKSRLLEGVEIDGQVCSFKSVEDGGGEGVNHWYRVVITEGRNREVRRLFEAVGHAVSRLIRIRYGSVVLPRGLKRGVWVDMDDHDLRALRRLTQPTPGAGAGGMGGAAAGAAPGAGPAVEGEGGPTRRKRRGGRRGGRDERGPEQAQGQRVPFERDGPADARPPREAREPRGPREPRPPRPPREAQVPRPQAEFDDDFMPANVSHLSPDVSGKRARPGRGAEGPTRGEPREDGAIPNPLQQTYDKRAIQQERALRRDMPDDGPIPNPLQQTYDKRALQQARNPQRDIPDDGPIPNPLQQTYDKRFAQGGGRGPGLGGGAGAGKGAGKGGGKFGKPGGKPGGKGGAKAGRGPGGPRKGGGGGGGGQPDPLKTAVGYIGGDAFLRKGAGGGGGRGGQRPRTGGGAGSGGLGGGGGGGGGGPRRGGGGQGGPGRGGRSR